MAARGMFFRLAGLALGPSLRTSGVNALIAYRQPFAPSVCFPTHSHMLVYTLPAQHHPMHTAAGPVMQFRRPGTALPHAQLVNEA